MCAACSSVQPFASASITSVWCTAASITRGVTCRRQRALNRHACARFAAVECRRPWMLASPRVRTMLQPSSSATDSDTAQSDTAHSDTAVDGQHTWCCGSVPAHAWSDSSSSRSSGTARMRAATLLAAVLAHMAALNEKYMRPPMPRNLQAKQAGSNQACCNAHAQHSWGAPCTTSPIYIRRTHARQKASSHGSWAAYCQRSAVRPTW